MPRYKLRLPPTGDYLCSDNDYWFIGETAEQAFQFFQEEMYEEDAEWVHPVILRGHILYKADIENGDAHEGAEPGDTTFSIVTEADSERALTRELASNEVRAWVTGPVRPWWTYGPNYGDPAGTYHGNVGQESIGNFESREAAKEAVDAAVAERVEVWKAAHPEFYRPLPKEPDDA